MSTAYFSLASGDFLETWSAIDRLKVNDDWSSVPSIVGYLGDTSPQSPNWDPRTVTAAALGAVDVIANQTNPSAANAPGGVAEFHLTDLVYGSTIALNGSGTADAPSLVLYLDATGRKDLVLSVDLRDLDGSGDDAAQSIAVQYRIGGTGNWINVEGGYLSDVTQGPGLSGQVTHLDVALGAAVDGQGQVEVRILTTNAVGNDEWVGIDNIKVTSQPTGGETVPVVSVEASDALAAEGTDPAFGFTFTRTGGDTTKPLTVSYTIGGTATAGEDYTPAATGTVTFGADETSVTLSFSAIDDPIVESRRESVQITLVDGATYNLGATATARADILNDDGQPVKIHEVQGAGNATGMADKMVVIEGIATGDFQNGDPDAARSLGGFFVQEERSDWDDNALTSEGIFVFGGSTSVNAGDKVRIVGIVTEFNGLTQITATKVEVVEAGAVADVASLAVDIALPGNLEAHEGMLVRVPQKLVVTDQEDLERLGEIRLYATEGDGLGGLVDEAADGRPYTFTQTNDPSVTGFAAHEAEVAKRSIIYDDGLNGTWQGIQNPNGGGAYGTATAPRSGDSIEGLVGVLDYGFGNFRIRSVADGQNEFAATNPREASPPDVGGSLTVASFNVLNYFVTLDNGGRTDNGEEPRGANSEAEFARQTEKLVNSIVTLDADVLALVEIENDFSKPSDALLTGGPGMAADLYRAEGNAIAFLVEKLNAKLGGDVYAWIDPGMDHVGTDAISNGIIYKKNAVRIAEGTTVAVDLNAVNDRPTVAVTFEEIATGGVFTAVANHFKSKRSGEGANADQSDGQARSNVDRIAQAQRLDAWLDSNPTGSDDADQVLLGDFNSYYQEDPIDVLRAAGYRIPFDASTSSYIYEGQLGTLDYAFVSGSLAGQVAGAAHWHINADEGKPLDYNLDSTSAAYVRDGSWFDPNSPYRVSDHDITLLSLNLKPANSAPTAIVIDGGSVEENMPGGTPVGTVTGVDPDGNPLTYSLVDDAGGRFAIDPVTGALRSKQAFDHEASGSFAIVVRASDPKGLSFDQAFTIAVADVNEAPVGTGDGPLAVDEDGATANLWAQLLSNDVDVDLGDMLRIALVDTSATKGSLVFDAATQSLRYVADADAFDLLATGATATDSFSYTVADEDGLTSTATVTLTITGMADGRTIKGGNGKDTLAGTDGEDAITGNNGNDTLSGLGGADKLDGGNGNDVLFGGAGIDTLLGGNGDDKLDGGDGADKLDGGLGYDQINGGAGDDIITGLNGHDLLTGGAGADVFVFGIASDIDKILDFNPNEDRIEFVQGAEVVFHEIRDTNDDNVNDTILHHSLGGIVILRGVEYPVGPSIDEYQTIALDRYEREIGPNEHIA